LPAQVGAQVPVRRDTTAGRRDTLPSRVDTVGRPRPAPPTRAADTIKVPVPPRADTMLKNDSARLGAVPLPEKAPRDSIKPPLSRAEGPPVFDIGPARVYDRTALYATGALTLSDLLSRVPGLTEFAAGALLAPSVVASQGDVRRVRVFLDGLALDPLDRRAQGVPPVNDLPLHALEEVRIERGAEEVRVYARSWRVDRTTPYTRADIATGDQNTNLYRAFFGRRYDRGEVLQLSAEQHSTQPEARLPSSSTIHVMARVGLTRGPWNADAFAERSDRDRGPWVGLGNFLENRDTISGFQTRRTTAYLRAANGDPDTGRWLQLLVSSHGWHGTPRGTSGSGAPSSSAPVQDSSAHELQYLLTGGLTRGALRLSAAERVRIADHRTSHVLSGRAAYESGALGISLFGEGQSALDPSRVEANVRFVPLARVAFTGAVSRTGSGTFARIFGDFQPTPLFRADGTLQRGSVQEFGGLYTESRVARYELPSRTNMRAEAGLRLADVWVSAGLLRRGATTLLPPADVDTTYARPAALRAEPEATARTLAIRGRLYRAVYADAWALAWTDPAGTGGLYRPKYQTRSELYIQTNLLDRFPRGNFGLLASLAHEYRSATNFAWTADKVRRVEGFRTVALKLEIRIQTAVLSYQFRNVLQEKYAEVPGFYLPRQTQFYGVRWDFWN
jgi:hypothetical protein